MGRRYRLSCGPGRLCSLWGAATKKNAPQGPQKGNKRLPYGNWKNAQLRTTDGPLKERFFSEGAAAVESCLPARRPGLAGGGKSLRDSWRSIRSKQRRGTTL